MNKKGEEELCQKCKKPRGKSRHKKLCENCLRSLPQCWSCGIICGAAEWDFLAEKKAAVFVFKKNGKEITLCGGCQETLEAENGCLRPERKSRNGKEVEIKKEELTKK